MTVVATERAYPCFRVSGVKTAHIPPLRYAAMRILWIGGIRPNQSRRVLEA